MISEENVILALADETLDAEEKEAMGKKIWRRRHAWRPGQMLIEPIKTPKNFSSTEKYWQVGK